ncbi:hypothetical protein R5W24_003694 [Gemmata sp. JC717]|uniref:DUF1501 domain-containing protein n=1 Tax=Gemmata algarum TaxID=2975278 RepID=A0ABU5F6D5_9BACT|nr:hypothetical protein [Gemmata algarum]MDY3554570.1 hypothetical protein [Gemmata algarum]MDY3562744.1 hypothetical protein [Gemmata algarum]
MSTTITPLGGGAVGSLVAAFTGFSQRQLLPGAIRSGSSAAALTVELGVSSSSDAQHEDFLTFGAASLQRLAAGGSGLEQQHPERAFSMAPQAHDPAAHPPTARGRAATAHATNGAT